MTDTKQTDLTFSENEVRNIPLGDIEPDDSQPRKDFREIELAESITVSGQIHPILVTTGKDGKYQIVDGERRWRAFNLLVEQAKDTPELADKDFSTIKALYVEKDSQLLGIIGNIARNEYSAIETADACASLKKLLGKDGEEAKPGEIGKYLGKSRPLISQYLSLHNLPAEVQDKARKDGCVPFNRLLKLQTRKGSDDNKIKWYGELHQEYSRLRDNEKTKGDNSQPKKAVKSSALEKKIRVIHTKIGDVNKSLGKMKLDKLGDAEKNTIKAELQRVKDTADSLLQKL